MKWFFSKTVRHLCAMRKHVEKLLNHQRDILAPKAVGEVEAAILETKNVVASGADKAALEKQMEKLEEAANKWLKPYPNAAWRENVEVLLVALAVAMAIRTFFLQPFKIPTGSMQPTLYGVTSENLLNQPDVKIPTGLARVKEWFEGISYLHVVAKEDGALEQVGTPVRLLIFNIKQTLRIGNRSYTLWFPPDYGSATLDQRAGMRLGQFFHTGDDVVKLKTQAGDHLFVDRVTYNFRPPTRGDIVVFETKGIPEEKRNDPAGRWHIPDDQFYIKRLVGLGSETISLQKDYDVAMNGATPPSVGHLVVNGQPLTASTPHFENLYSFNDAPPGTNTLTYRENHYFGHALVMELAEGHQFQIPTNHFFAMGDNTMNSLDSRYWGDFPASSVIGKSFFVYWPLSSRFGWGVR